MTGRTTTWQEGDIWYAAPAFCFSSDPVGEGETEEDAILDLGHKIHDLNEEARIRWEARHDEP
jgi:hypothetical protein